MELASLTLWTLLHEPQAGEAPVPGRRSVRGVGAAMLCGTAWLAGFSQSGDYEDVHRAVFELAPQSPVLLALALSILLLAFPIRVLLAASGREPSQAPALDAFVAVGFTAAGLALSMRVLFPVLSTPGAEGRWTHASGLDWTRMLLATEIVFASEIFFAIANSASRKIESAPPSNRSSSPSTSATRRPCFGCLS